jgi:transcriptional regulator with XRE-family HTH domain
MARRKMERGRGIAQRLKAARKRSGLTVRELAKQANLSHQTVVSIESGSGAHSSVSTLGDLAEALKVPAGWLAYGEGAAPTPSDNG